MKNTLFNAQNVPYSFLKRNTNKTSRETEEINTAFSETSLVLHGHSVQFFLQRRTEKNKLHKEKHVLSSN
ncbi:MAG: hypothetical protein D3914_07105 [Candidatus Electrothrix sp. LOE2]|nr:hypothetical protein [Candidatus Electrothrix sp. LOE2]